MIIGYTERYGNFTFATVHGAGHMVGRTKGAQLLTLITKFINGLAL